MAVMNFGGVDENVVTREEFPLEKAREVLKDEVIVPPPAGAGAARFRGSPPSRTWDSSPAG